MNTTEPGCPVTTLSDPVGAVRPVEGATAGAGLRVFCRPAPPAIARQALLMKMIEATNWRTHLLSFIERIFLILVESLIVGGVTKHTLNVPARFRKRNVLDPVFDVHRTARGDPRSRAARPRVVGSSRVLYSSELAEHLSEIIHAQLDVEHRVIQIGGGDRAVALTLGDQLAGRRHDLHQPARADPGNRIRIE